MDICGYPAEPDHRRHCLRTLGSAAALLGLPPSLPFGLAASAALNNHPRKIHDLTDALVRRGYSDNNIQAVLGGNFRRLLGESWRQPPQTEKKS